MGIVTPLGVRTPGEGASGEVEREGLDGIAVDFVEEGSEEEGDEGEMRKVVWGRVGGWVDWAVGWMDFRVDEEGIEDGDAEGLGGPEESTENVDAKMEEKGKAVDGRRRRRKRDERDRINVRRTDDVGAVVVEPPKEGEGVWKDAAWLLSVATKVIV